MQHMDNYEPRELYAKSQRFTHVPYTKVNQIWIKHVKRKIMGVVSKHIKCIITSMAFSNIVEFTVAQVQCIRIYLFFMR